MEKFGKPCHGGLIRGEKRWKDNKEGEISQNAE